MSLEEGNLAAAKRPNDHGRGIAPRDATKGDRVAGTDALRPGGLDDERRGAFDDSEGGGGADLAELVEGFASVAESGGVGLIRGCDSFLNKALTHAKTLLLPLINGFENSKITFGLIPGFFM